MCESNSDPNVKVAYIVTETDINNTYKPCSVLQINVANNESIKLLQIPDNNKPATPNQSVLNFPKANDEFTLANSKSNIVYRVLRPEDLDLKLPTPENVPKAVKRPKQKKQFVDQETEDRVCDVVPIPKKIFRTRSGRMSKPPKHIQQDELSQTITNVNSSSEEKSEITSVPKTNFELIEKKSSSKTIEYKRKISSQYRCGTCKKAYLGQNKMMKHLQLNPQHIAPNFNKKSDLNLWPELLRKTNEVPKKQQSQLFCKELINLIYKARSVIPKLLKTAVTNEDSNFSVDSVVSNALGIPEGKYSFDEAISVNEVANVVNNDNKDNFIEMKEIEDCLENESENVHNHDQNSLLNLLDTGQVTFDSSSNSEEVMKNVDQLVNERLKTLTGGESGEIGPPNNGPQNLSLDLSLDMFYHGP